MALNHGHEIEGIPCLQLNLAQRLIEFGIDTRLIDFFLRTDIPDFANTT